MKIFQLDDIRITLDRHEILKEFDAVVVILFCAEKIVLVWNQERGWEFPGGHREGSETYQATAIREVREESQVEIRDLEYLGFYTSKLEYVTIIVYAECLNFVELDETLIPSGVKAFDGLPSPLSYGDGGEQLILEVARKFINPS